MQRTRWAIGLVLLLVFAAQWAVSSPAINKPPHSGLSGLWRADVTPTLALLLKLDAKTIDMKLNSDGTETALWSGSLALSAQHPDQQMDWTGLSSANGPVPDNKCLYQLSGDTLLVIGGGPEKRPTGFYSGPGAEPKTLIFQRVKPEPVSKVKPAGN